MPVEPEHLTERERRWAATMTGQPAVGENIDLVCAHQDSYVGLGCDGSAFEPGHGPPSVGLAVSRAAREDAEDAWMVPDAVRAQGGGNRSISEEPDPLRTCFERDRDRILHSAAFRRLAGKTQVFIFPRDHQRTRLTHSLEVAQVATSVARALRLNVALADAIALGHDCGHGPFGHASEDALTPYVEGGFDHAMWGANVATVGLNLCAETLDGIRNHSWSLPAPSSPEAEVVSWADRIAYVCHDFADGVAAGVVSPCDLPPVVAERCGRRQSQQLGTFITAMIETAVRTGRIGMDGATAEALAAFRRFNYEHIYLRADSIHHGHLVHRVLGALVEFYAGAPNELELFGDEQEVAGVGLHGHDPGTPEALVDAVEYVAGMTDRFAFDQAVTHLGWSVDRLPRPLR